MGHVTPTPSLSNGDLDPARLAALEAKIGPLPEDFRDLLVRYNGAFLGECDTGLVDARGEAVTISWLIGLHGERWESLSDETDDLPPGFLRIATRGISHHFVLQLADDAHAKRGAIWFFDDSSLEDLEGEYVYFRTFRSLYAASTAAFLDRLVPRPAPHATLPEVDENSEDGVPAVKDPPDAPSPEKPLVLAGEARAVRSARFAIDVATEAWDDAAQVWRYGPEHAQARYTLEIDVDEESGEDGAASPEAEIPIARAAGGQPSLEALVGLTVDDRGDWEAWFGNDAPPLEDNQLTFLARTPEGFVVRWEATYDDQPFLFEGPVVFDGIRLKVKVIGDADTFFARVFAGVHDGESFERLVGEEVDFGSNAADWPEDRRRWTLVSWKPRRP